MEQTRKPLARRALCLLLAAFMLLVSIPLSSMKASAWGGWGRPGQQNPDVLTNAVVRFVDGAYKQVEECASG